ncbi:MAG: hypothetical protein Q7T46_11545 [Polaromonas sp.]|nr:hypothetical protein [Polaromonas sp.]
MKSPDLDGMIFGRLTVVGRSEYKQPGRPGRWWVCRCSCGKDALAMTGDLTTGHKKSCGCLSVDVFKKNMVIHGKTNTKEFVAWRNMIQRCERPHHPQYASYGGRGIGVCERWHEAAAFLADMGEAPARHTLERIDNEKGYSPENCRWATHKEQLRNRRNTVWATLDGQTKSLAEWCEIRGYERDCKDFLKAAA